MIYTPKKFSQTMPMGIPLVFWIRYSDHEITHHKLRVSEHVFLYPQRSISILGE